MIDIRDMALKIVTINQNEIMKASLTPYEFKRFKQLSKSVKSKALDFTQLEDDDKAEYAYFGWTLKNWAERMIMPRLLDFHCYSSYKKYYNDLLEKAKAGDDESLLKLVRLFKNIIEEQPFIKERFDRAVKDKDREFQDNYSKTRSTKPPRVRYDLIFHIIMAWEFCSLHTPEAIEYYLVKMVGLKDINKNQIWEYCQRMKFHTSLGKRDKRNEVVVKDVP
jgi:hypothetical protein